MMSSMNLDHIRVSRRDALAAAAGAAVVGGALPLRAADEAPAADGPAIRKGRINQIMHSNSETPPELSGSGNESGDLSRML